MRYFSNPCGKSKDDKAQNIDIYIIKMHIFFLLKFILCTRFSSEFWRDIVGGKGNEEEAEYNSWFSCIGPVFWLGPVFCDSLIWPYPFVNDMWFVY